MEVNKSGYLAQCQSLSSKLDKKNKRTKGLSITPQSLGGVHAFHPSYNYTLYNLSTIKAKY